MGASLSISNSLGSFPKQTDDEFTLFSFFLLLFFKYGDSNGSYDGDLGMCRFTSRIFDS